MKRIEKILAVRELNKTFGDLKAVDNLSLETYSGELLSILGPNGAGKTTTMEILEGLSPADGGEIEIFGLNWQKGRQEILRRIGVVLQKTNLYKRYTVLETLQLFANLYPQSTDIDQLIERLQLGEKRNTKLKDLSGGQWQRVNVGCALVHKPELLFLDEPTTGLDPQARRHMWDLIEDVKKTGCSIILTTHYMEEAEYLSDRIAVMDQGRIIAQGTAKELINKHTPGQFLTLETIPEPLADSMDWIDKSQIKDNSFTIKVEDASNKLLEITRFLDQNNLEIGNINLRQPTLEDVFLKLTGRSLRDE